MIKFKNFIVIPPKKHANRHAFLLLHMGFLKFIAHTKGLTKALGVITVCYIDAFLMLMGLLFGSLSYFLRRKY